MFSKHTLGKKKKKKKVHKKNTIPKRKVSTYIYIQQQNTQKLNPKTK